MDNVNDFLSDITIPRREQINIIQLCRHKVSPLDLRRMTGIDLLQIHLVLQHKIEILEQWTEDSKAFDAFLLIWIKHYRKKNVSKSNMSNIGKHAKIMAKLLDVKYSITPELWSKIDKLTNQEQYHIPKSTKLDLDRMYTILKNDCESILNPQVYRRFLEQLEGYLFRQFDRDYDFTVSDGAISEKDDTSLRARTDVVRTYEKQKENYENYMASTDSNDDDDIIPIENPILHIDLSEEKTNVCNETQNTSFSTMDCPALKTIKMEPIDNDINEVETEQEVKLEPSIKKESIEDNDVFQAEEFDKKLNNKQEHSIIKTEANDEHLPYIKIEATRENIQIPILHDEDNTNHQSIKHEDNDDDDEDIPVIYELDLVESEEDETNIEDILEIIKKDFESGSEEPEEDEEEVTFLEIVSDSETEGQEGNYDLNQIKDIIEKAKMQRKTSDMEPEDHGSEQEIKDVSNSPEEIDLTDDYSDDDNIPSTSRVAKHDLSKSNDEQMEHDSDSSISETEHEEECDAQDNDYIPSTSRVAKNGLRPKRKFEKMDDDSDSSMPEEVLTNAQKRSRDTSEIYINNLIKYFQKRKDKFAVTVLKRLQMSFSSPN